MPAYVLTWIYTVLMHLSLVELYHEVAALRLAVTLGSLALLVWVACLPLLVPAWRGQTLWAFAGFTVVLLLSRVLHGWFGGGLKAFSDYMPTALVMLLVATTSTTVRRMKILGGGLLLVGLFFIARGAMDYYSGPETETQFLMLQRTEDPQTRLPTAPIPRVRGLGVLSDPNDLAQYLLVLMALIGLGTPGRVLSKFWAVPMQAVLIFGMYLTRSRGGLLGLGVFVLLWIWRRFRWGGLVPVMVLMALATPYLALSMGREVSIGAGMGRLDLWSDGLGLFKSSPLIGIGYRMFADFATLTAHNSFLLCLAELGLLGFLFWAAMFWTTLLPLWRIAYPAQGEETAPAEYVNWAQRLVAAMLVYLSTSWFLSRLYEALPLVLLGMGSALIMMESKRRGQSLQLPIRRSVQLSFISAFVVVALLYIMVRLRGLA